MSGHFRILTGHWYQNLGRAFLSLQGADTYVCSQPLTHAHSTTPCKPSVPAHSSFDDDLMLQRSLWTEWLLRCLALLDKAMYIIGGCSLQDHHTSWAGLYRRLLITRYYKLGQIASLDDVEKQNCERVETTQRGQTCASKKIKDGCICCSSLRAEHHTNHHLC